MAAILDLLKLRGSGLKFLGLTPEMPLVCLNLALYQIWHLYPPGEHIPQLFDRLTHCTILNTMLTRIYNAELFCMNHGDQSGFFSI